MPRRKIDWYGPRLRQLRERAGLSQAELGQRVDLAGSQINKLETNVNQPTLATALAIAEAIGVPITEFVSAADGTDRPAAAAGKRPRGRPRKPAIPAPPVADELQGQAAAPKRQRGRPSRRKGM